MDIGYSVRPVICRIEDDVLTHGFFGSGFMVWSEMGFPYFITMSHVLTNHGRQYSDMCIPFALGEYEILPLGVPERYPPEKFPYHSDLLIFPFSAAFAQDKKIEYEPFPLRFNNPDVEVGHPAIVVGFPHEMQEVFYEENRGVYVPTYIKGRISYVDNVEREVVMETPLGIDIESFNMFSGSPIYAYPESRSNEVYLAGIVVQGSRQENLLRAISAKCLLDLIRIRERELRFGR